MCGHLLGGKTIQNEKSNWIGPIFQLQDFFQAWHNCNECNSNIGVVLTSAPGMIMAVSFQLTVALV